VKFLQIDFFDTKDNPPPVLPFPVPPNYIPAAVSTMKNLEDAVVRAVNRMPELADEILRVVVKVSGLLDEVTSKKLPDQVSLTLKQTNATLATLQTTLNDVHAGKISASAQAALGNLNGTIDRMNLLLGRLDGDKGLFASAQRASTAVGDVAVNARGLGQEMEETLRDIQEVTASVQHIADALERDPDMLLKGRGKAK
jgi:phospholipid/cholesterol/gamma-HCH transport system substrate-binding protein